MVVRFPFIVGNAIAEDLIIPHRIAPLAAAIGGSGNNLYARNKEKPEPAMQILAFWSEWGDSNSRHLEPKGERFYFYKLLYYVLPYLLWKLILSGTLCATDSAR